MTLLQQNEESQVHHDRYHGTKFVATYSPVHIDIDGVPEINDITAQLERQENDDLKFSGNQIVLQLSSILECQTRVQDFDPNNVNEITNYREKVGHDPLGKPCAIVKFRGKYYLINGHHQVKSLIEQGHRKWLFDLYEYIGLDDQHVFENAVHALGKKINNSELPRKKQTPTDYVTSTHKIIQKNYEKYGVPCLRLDKEGNPILLCDSEAEWYLDYTGFTNYWRPDLGGGKKSTYTHHKNKIVNGWKGADISGIRSVSEKRRKEVLSRNPQHNVKGNLTSVNLRGYCVSTNDPAADGANVHIQMARYGGNVDFLTYNTKISDDPSGIPKQEEVLYQTAYTLYVDTINMHNDLKLLKYGEKAYEDLKLKETPVDPDTYWKYLKGDRSAITQLDGEEGDTVKRKIVTKDIVRDGKEEDSTIPELDRIMNIA